MAPVTVYSVIPRYTDGLVPDNLPTSVTEARAKEIAAAEKEAIKHFQKHDRRAAARADLMGLCNIVMRLRTEGKSIELNDLITGVKFEIRTEPSGWHLSADGLYAEMETGLLPAPARRAAALMGGFLKFGYATDGRVIVFREEPHRIDAPLIAALRRYRVQVSTPSCFTGNLYADAVEIF